MPGLTINPASAPRGRAGPVAAANPTDRVLSALLWLFCIVCIFDPADKLLGIKVWVFAACVAYGFATAQRRGDGGRVPRALINYVIVFVGIPFVWVIWFKFTNLVDRDEGFALLKGYLLVGLAPVLAANRIDLMPVLAKVLCLLSVAILTVALALLVAPGLYGPLSEFGVRTGIVIFDERFYSSSFSLQQIYFVTSPMLVMAIAYYFTAARLATNWRSRRWYRVLVGLNIIAMMVAGTRNNILFAALLPVGLVFMQSRNKVIGAAIGVLALLSLIYYFSDQILVFFDPSEVSNSTKIALFDDYISILSDPRVLLFGQGLGVYQYWYGKGSFEFITELTYFEMIRNFGIFAATVMMILLIIPVRRAFAPGRSLQDRASGIAFAVYLVMCFSNPNLFSSMGILILSIMIANFYTNRPPPALERAR